MKDCASLKRLRGRTKSSRSAYRRSSGSWKRESSKNQFSSRSRISGMKWMRQVLPGPISASVLKSAQRGQYQPS